MNEAKLMSTHEVSGLDDFVVKFFGPKDTPLWRWGLESVRSMNNEHESIHLGLQPLDSSIQSKTQIFKKITGLYS